MRAVLPLARLGAGHVIASVPGNTDAAVSSTSPSLMPSGEETTNRHDREPPAPATRDLPIMVTLPGSSEFNHAGEYPRNKLDRGSTYWYSTASVMTLGCGSKGYRRGAGHEANCSASKEFPAAVTSGARHVTDTTGLVFEG